MKIIFEGSENNTAKKPTVLDQGAQNIQDTTELGEAIKEAFKDETEPGKRVSSIDMKANLHPAEIVGLIAWDTMVGMKIIPMEAGFLSRQKKRISVSEHAMGRNNMVNMTTGQRAHQENREGGVGGMIKGLFKKRNPEVPQ